MMVGGATTVACLAHCVGVCTLCVSSGTALGITFGKTFRLIMARLGPTMMTFGASLFFLGRSLA